MNEQLRRDSIRRLANKGPNPGGARSKRDLTVPKTDTPPEKKKLHVEELPWTIIPEEHESQIGESNLEEGDVIIYLRAVTFKPGVFKNIANRGPGAVAEYATKQPAYFLITREDCAGDVLKALLEGNLKPSENQEEE